MTPGPWGYDYKSLSIVSYYTGGRQLVAGFRSGTVSEDDARLIAAGPELLAALKAVLPMIVGEVPMKAIEAIAKAEGK